MQSFRKGCEEWVPWKDVWKNQSFSIDCATHTIDFFIQIFIDDNRLLIPYNLLSCVRTRGTWVLEHAHSGPSKVKTLKL